MSEDAEQVEDQSPSQADNIDSEARHGVVQKAIKTLSQRQQEVLELVFGHDLTLREAAKVLELSEGSVRQHYERAKANLRKMKVIDETR